MKDITASWYDIDDNKIQYEEIIIEEPRQCMHCKNTGAQIFLNCILDRKCPTYSGIALYSCQFCGLSTVHFLMNYRSHTIHEYFETIETIPSLDLVSIKFTEPISDKFKNFCEIYKQAEISEENKLTHLSGMGYRKALEFLVTDYLIEYPVDGVEKEWLTNPDTRLGNKISKIESKRIQKLAKAISFLGNDETHYTRKHPEYDVSSIKSFIAVLLSEIQNEIDFQEAEKLLNKPKI